MPELPEVETVCRGLIQTVIDTTIDDVITRRDRLRIPIPSNLSTCLIGNRITKIHRRAKYVLIDLDNEHTIIIHLGMSGRIIVTDTKPKTWDKHDHVIMTLSHNHVMIYNDPRRFGLITLSSTKALDQHPLLAHLGVEPLEDSFDGTMLQTLLKRKTKPIKQAIMDAHDIVGVGNIYASESLFESKTHPKKPANSLTKKEYDNLAKAIKHVLLKAIESGGSTLRNYTHTSGQTGYFQHEFKVYDREKEPCTICTKPIEKCTQSGRSTFYCPSCQPL